MEVLKVSKSRNAKDTFIGEFKHVFMSSGAYGGENVAMAAKAAVMSVEPSYLINSVHCYYLRPGRKGQVCYHVNRVKDGQRFCFRNVVGTQEDKPIITCMVSFKSSNNEDKDRSNELTHNKYPMPLEGNELENSVPSSEVSSLVTDSVTEDNITLEVMFHNPPPSHLNSDRDRKLTPSVEPKQKLWMKPVNKLAAAADQNDHRLGVLYASDHCLSGLIYYKYPEMDGTFSASLDHSIYFHSDHIDFNEWHLFDNECVFSAGELGLNTSRIYSQNGEPVATAVQQAYARLRGKL